VPDSPSTHPGPGWYSDPWGIEPLRWWDGRTWTGYTVRRNAPDVDSDAGGQPPSTRAGDAIRAVRFRQTLKGYSKESVDAFLLRVAREADTGPISAAVLAHAPFPARVKGYHRDEVDDFVRQLAPRPALNDSKGHGRDVAIAARGVGPSSDPVWTAEPTKKVVAYPGWTPLKVALTTIFGLAAVFAVFAGAATWHSVESRPHVVAQVTSQFHCVTNSDTGVACDERTVFNDGARRIRTVVRSIDPGRDLSGVPGHQQITVFYDPNDPFHVEASDGVALNGIELILGGFAVFVVAVVACVQITRAGRKANSGIADRSEIHRSIVS
jgi:DivIVA domain-containing protein